MEKKWKEVDKDGKGQVLFVEFVDWAYKNKLDLDDDDNADNFEGAPPKNQNQTSSRSNNYSNLQK